MEKAREEEMSMNEIMVFEHERFGRIRGIEIDGESWFACKDVAKSLGYADTYHAFTAYVESDDKQILKRSQNATLVNQVPNRGLTIINESGLFSLALRSNLPEANAFIRWVTHDVLPALRKTCEYKLKRNPLDYETCRKLADAKARNAQNLLQAALWINIAELICSSEVHKQICAAYASKSLEGEMVFPLPTVESERKENAR